METQAIELYKKGMSDRQIGEELGLSRSVVTKWRERHNLKGNRPHVLPRNETRIFLSEEVLREFVAKGMTIRNIVEETGWSARTVSTRLTNAGIKGNKRDYKLSPLEDLSICWSCVHAYGDDCLGVPIEDRIWVTVVAIIQTQTHPDSEPYEIHQVKACKRYERGRRKPHIIDKNAAYRLMEAIMKKDVYPDTEIEQIWAEAKAKEAGYING